jgi:hypothetical protein
MSRKEKEDCGCVHFHNAQGHERVTLCPEHQTEADERHAAFVKDRRESSARLTLEESFL